MPIDVVAQGWLQPPSKSCIVVMFKQFIPKMINNETLEMLTAREQLMEDITATLDQYFQDELSLGEVAHQLMNQVRTHVIHEHQR